MNPTQYMLWYMVSNPGSSEPISFNGFALFLIIIGSIFLGIFCVATDKSVKQTLVIISTFVIVSTLVALVIGYQ